MDTTTDTEEEPFAGSSSAFHTMRMIVLPTQYEIAGTQSLMHSEKCSIGCRCEKKSVTLSRIMKSVCVHTRLGRQPLFRSFRQLLWLLWLPMAVNAAVYTPATVPDPKKNGQGQYVSNPDGILSADEVAYINRCARMIEDSTRAELAVAALSSIGDMPMFDFAYQLFQRWGIGKEGQNTGVLICFALESHDIRIVTGTGIEGVLPDARCKRIIDDDMIPSFRQEKYGEGLCLGALRILEACSEGSAPEELLAMRSVTQRTAPKEDKLIDDTLLDWLGVLLGIACVLGVVWLYNYLRSRCPRCGKHTLGRRSNTLVAATTFHTGLGEEICTCRHCGYQSRKTFVIPRIHISSGGGSGGGSFGGGSWGGGSTSGGGAGGRW